MRADVAWCFEKNDLKNGSAPELKTADVSSKRLTFTDPNLHAIRPNISLPVGAPHLNVFLGLQSQCTCCTTGPISRRDKDYQQLLSIHIFQI